MHARTRGEGEGEEWEGSPGPMEELLWRIGFGIDRDKMMEVMKKDLHHRQRMMQWHSYCIDSEP